MWTCSYRATTEALANANVSAICCAATNGTLHPNGKCALPDRGAYAACATQPDYAAGVWTCENDEEWCTGQGVNNKCTTFRDKDNSHPKSGAQSVGAAGARIGAMVLVAMVAGMVVV